MNNEPTINNGLSTKLDPIFYKNRYNIDSIEKDTLMRHYEEIGKAKGYFPNAEKHL